MPDGKSAVVTSNISREHTWLISDGPIRENSVFHGEVFDARLDNPNWDHPDVPLENGVSVVQMNGFGGRLVSATLEPIKVVDTMKAETGKFCHRSGTKYCRMGAHKGNGETWHPGEINIR
jgi:hypothetical protein